MKLLHAGIICLACVLLVGCEEQQAKKQTEKNLDVELVNTVNNIQVENAIIVQHTLYPYHFVTDGSSLNELGEKDLAVLAKHFKEYPGVLNVRKGDSSDELYKARIAQVQERLKEAGVPVDRMSICDGMPGGPGMPSERVVAPPQQRSRSSTGTSTGTSGMITR